MFDRYTGEDSTKAVARYKKVGNFIEGPRVPLPQLWSTFMDLDENKANLSRFLSDLIMIKDRHLPEYYKMVTVKQKRSKQ